MAFSNRDNNSTSPICCSPLTSERGQGTIEYVLILVVAVAIILGALYQLNTAFKVWANNYFGDYLACLLETGELPTIGGSPGDSGVCAQLFKPFNLAEGFQRRSTDGGQGQQNDTSPGAGASERAAGGGTRFARSGGGGSGSNVNRSGTRIGRRIGGGGTTFSGNTDSSGYGGGYTYIQRPVAQSQRTKLDNRFAFEDRGDRPQRRTASAAKKDDNSERRKGAIKLKPNAIKKDQVEQAGSDFSIGNFIRYIIIIALILALILFIGGQVLSISKSMER